MKILVANRGEIALRVMRTCREMGIPTVAVYSEADRHAPFVRYADESVGIGPPPARESYLDQEKIVEAARRTKAGAVHPGYGFLSENPSFAERLRKEGILFIGPSPEAIRSLGDKTSARRMAVASGVPVVPGMTETLTDANAATLIKNIGYPLLLKAAGGGGGKGMRVVRGASDLAAAIRAGRSEALSAFGDDRLYIEKFIERPKHVEVQVLGDGAGNAVHLGERECSIQRRHQKIIEESPSSAMDARQRGELAEAALELIRAARYANAGTVEFLLDGEGKFYFLEVNTRLQVEHPVTEMRTGIDLVREQIGIAERRSLRLTQKDISFNGCAVECRIYAEDPSDNYYPSTGMIRHLRRPGGFGIREESGIEEGMDVSPYYDPLLSKLIAWAPGRGEALARMSAALAAYRIFGVRNNLALLAWIVGHPRFRCGERLGRLGGCLPHGNGKGDGLRCRWGRRRQMEVSVPIVVEEGMKFIADTGGTEVTLEINDNKSFYINGQVVLIQVVHKTGHSLLTMAGKTHEILCLPAGEGRYEIWIGHDVMAVAINDEYSRRDAMRSGGRRGDEKITIAAPMPGLVTQIEVEEGAEVRQGDGLCILEAMKMENEIRSPAGGRVERIAVRKKATVEKGEVIMVLTPIKQ